MGTVVDLATWRRARGRWVAAQQQHPSVLQGEGQDGKLMERLERAVARLQPLVGAEGDRIPLAPEVHTELLAVLGELAVGLLSEAAGRAERLAEQLARGGPPARW